MKWSMRAVLCLLLLALPVAGQPAEAPEAVRVVMVDNGLPFGTILGGQGQGIVPDMLALASIHGGVPFELVPVPDYPEAAARVRDGTADAYGPTVIVPGSGLAYSEPFAWARLGFWVLEGRPSDQAFARIAHWNGSIAADFLAEAYPNAQRVPVDAARAGLDALRRGEVDAYYGGLADVGHLVRNAAVTGIRQQGEPQQVLETRFAGSPEAIAVIDEALAKVPADARLAVYIKWTGTDLGPAQDTTPAWLIWLLTGSIAFAGLALVAVVVFRQQVRHHTQSVRQDRDRLRRVMDADPSGLMVVDSQGVLRYINPRAAKLLGVGDVVGKSLYDGWAALDMDGNPLPEADLPLPRALAGHTIAGQQCRLRSPSGKELAVSLNAAPLIENNVRGGVVFAFADLTPMQAFEEADRVAFIRRIELARLEEMDRFKTQFINAAAHELNTPLTPIRIQLHMLQSEALGQLDEKQAKALHLLDRNFDRLGMLVGDMLDVARVQSGRLEIRPKEVDVAPIVKEAIDIFADQAELQRVELDAQVPDSARACVDVPRFSQILYNLLSNALKFTPPGGHVALRTHEANDMLVVSIQDSGAGMDPSQIAKLFHPFARVHTAVPHAPPGTGLGLYITKGLVELHGGTIDVTSPGPDQGSTFTFRIPIHARAEDAAPVPQSSSPSSESAAS